MGWWLTLDGRKTTMRKLLRRVGEALRFRWLDCEGCGASQRIRTKDFGSTIVLDERVHGWTFTSDRGWHCPCCTDVLG